MDTSKQYIKMCEEAEEIQGSWNPKDGDYAWHPDEGADYMGEWEFPEEVTVVRITEQQSAKWWHHWLWLPRQDQLQEMVGDNVVTVLESFNQEIGYIPYYAVDEEVGDWEVSSDYIHFTSMEQLWLAFVTKLGMARSG